MSRNFDDWLQAYLAYSDPISESPERMRWWAAVSTVASALGGKVSIPQEGFEWKPNLFLFIVGPPASAAKSTTLKMAHKFSRGLENVVTGSDSSTWQYTLDELAEAKRTYEDPDTGEEIVTSSLVLKLSEAETYLDPTDKEQCATLCDLWDAPPEFKRGTRKDGGNRIEGPWLHIAAGTTPEFITRKFDQDAIGGGLLSRMLLVWAEGREKLIAYPADQAGQANSDLRRKLEEDIEAISWMAGRMALSEEAKEFGTEWYREHNESKPQIQEPLDPLLSFRDRKQAHAHKLAIILSAARRPTRIVERRDLEDAIAAIDKVEDDVRVVARGITSDSPEAKHTIHMREWFEQVRQAYKMEVYQTFAEKIGVTAVDRSLESLQKAGFIEKGPKKEGKGVLFRVVDHDPRGA